jgi:hypothetical protein
MACEILAPFEENRCEVGKLSNALRNCLITNRALFLITTAASNFSSMACENLAPVEEKPREVGKSSNPHRKVVILHRELF